MEKGGIQGLWEQTLFNRRWTEDDELAGRGFFRTEARKQAFWRNKFSYTGTRRKNQKWNIKGRPPFINTLIHRRRMFPELNH